MFFTVFAKAAGYICYYAMYYSARCVYSMLTADPSAILLIIP